ncbi:IucA/IucC family siderophore biosynthesis protein [Saccharopolyspora sp. ASAGF58]|uniref:IucA/IucC family protein n=1 Tax=Saccharopolyspora sp. ASAGF58 TaxID=2719023 RepID=UPI00143FC6F2|nr:IucA/IucC family protein [Saccharopolyspora sp. ASAGF58]QIZ37482.1 IucA/IucC family siderophore biosynthesis protein [Saccharopolyspora sp. ASAGF58]
MKDVLARAVARQRMLNALAREIGGEVSNEALRIPLRAADGVLRAEVRYRSESGHHSYGPEVFRELVDGSRLPVDHDEFVALIAGELAERGVEAPAGAAEEFSRQVANSVARTARYLAREQRPTPVTPAEITQHAEQSLLLGHPFHPTPKSAEGFSDDELARYAPELGASFQLHHWAVAPDLLLEDRVADGPWIPTEVEEKARTALHPDQSDYELLPVHPWQAAYLQRQPQVSALVDAGRLVPLGPLGAEVYATSSVRTVCDPSFGTAWKLPLHVRITNFVRNNPVEHLRRAADAGRLVGDAANRWRHGGFEVLPETGYRTVDPDVVGDLAADFAVLFRRNSFTGSGTAPQVLAALLEDRLDGRAPMLVDLVAEAGPLSPGHVADWFLEYLRISLGPVLAVFTDQGISFEAHVQNTLLHFEDGWPRRFFVRDMEGTSASRDRVRPGIVPPGSPVLYDDAEAWMRLRYHLVTNHLGHLVAVLGRFTPASERQLWSVVRDFLHQCPGRYAAELLATPVLPAKANLLSRFAERGERPLYVDVPNPIREVNR